MKKSKKKEPKAYLEYFDEMSEESLFVGQSKLEWLEWLYGLRDELNIQIRVVENELGK